MVRPKKRTEKVKTRSRSKGGSPIVDLTSFGFSRGKRTAPPAAPAEEEVVASSPLSSSSSDSGSSPSPQKRARRPSPPAANGGSASAGGGPPSSSSPSRPTTTSRVALLDLTARDASDMADACVDAILAGGLQRQQRQHHQQQQQQQRRGKRDRRGGVDGGVNGGDAIAVFKDPVEGGGSSAGGGDGLESSSSSSKAIISLEGKVAVKVTSSSPPPKPARGGSIQSYFSAASPAPPSSSSSSPPTRKGAGRPTAAGAASATTTTTTPAPRSPDKNGGPRGGGDAVARVDALALVRVDNPYTIACSLAVAHAREEEDRPAAARDRNHPIDLDRRPRPIFPGAVVGRTSSSTRNGRDFVDLGIPGTTLGISRRHLEVLSIVGLSADGGGGGDDGQPRSSSSGASLAVSSTASSAGSSAARHPSMLVRVHESSTNGANFYRTRRGGERTLTYVPQGSQVTLRIGDAIEFFSNDKISFCVVGLVHRRDAAAAEIDDDDRGGGGTEAVGGNGSAGVVGGGASKDVVPLSRGTSATERTEVVVKPDGTSSSSSSVVRDPVGMELSQETISFVKSTSADIPGASNSGTVSSVVRDRLCDDLVAPVCMEMSQKTASLAELRCEDIPDAVNSGSLSMTAGADELTEIKCDDNLAAICHANADIAPVEEGNYVKCLYEVTDMFRDVRKEWYFGNVVDVKGGSNTQLTCKIRVQFDDRTFDTFEYPSPDVERLATSEISSEQYPETFTVGDVVDAFFQDGKCYHRGRVTVVDGDGKTCNIIYYDRDYESSIPTREKKIRLVHRCDSSEGWRWLVGKAAMLPRDGDVRHFKSGIVSKTTAGDYQIMFPDGSIESVSYEEAVKAVFDHLCKDLPLSKQYIWPVSMTTSMADTIRLRRQRKEHKQLMDESSQPIPEVKAKPTNRARSAKSFASKVVLKAEPVDETFDTLDELDGILLDDDDADLSDLYVSVQGGPAVDLSVLEKRKTAKDFPPGLPNMLWCGLNSPEAQTASNFLWDLLCVHDSVPPSTMIQKLMDLMKYGPKAEGSSLYFKDPHRTELAAQYVYGLLWASKRLARRDSGALFGPSSWDDIEVLMAQSLAETENMISGRRLAQGLQLAARGAKLLATMLLTELSGHDLYSTSNVILDITALSAMPTVRLIKTYGVRSALKAAVEHMTKCLVRHSRWIMDSGGVELSTNKSTSDESCCLESRVCIDNMGYVICVIAWLFCVEEMVELKDPSVAFVIKDSFLVEMERALDDVPEMNERNKKKFVKKCKVYFIMSFVEDFAAPLKMSLAKMIGVNDDFALIGLR